MKTARILAILVLALVVGLPAGVANADFTFGTPTNLGPTVNSSDYDWSPSIPADGLELYFESDRPGGEGTYDIWVSTRASKEDDWGAPTNLGASINTSEWQNSPCISADGLELYFNDWGLWVVRRATVSDPWGEPENGSLINVNTSNVSSGPCLSSDGLSLFLYSWDEQDLYVSTRPTRDDLWSEPVNLGPTVNGVNSTWENSHPTISADGLSLVFTSDRDGGSGGTDLWMTRRSTIDGPWSEPVNLGPTVNGDRWDTHPEISADGRSLLFSSNRHEGRYGRYDIWQASIDPVVDLNGDGIVDCADMCIIVDHWGTDKPLCDIGPMPWGDGIVDVQDLIVLAEHLFEGIPPVELEDVNVDEDDDGSQVELEQGQILVVTLESNPTTGYGWEVSEIQESILEQIGEEEFKPSDEGEPPMVGSGGWEIFTFEAISAGQTTLQLVYRRPWEEGVEPINTFSIEVVVN